MGEDIRIFHIEIKNPSVFVLIDSVGHTGVVLLCCEISIRKLEVKDIEGKLSRN